MLVLFDWLNYYNNLSKSQAFEKESLTIEKKTDFLQRVGFLTLNTQRQLDFTLAILRVSEEESFIRKILMKRTESTSDTGLISACLISYYHRHTRRLWSYLSETVPWADDVALVAYTEKVLLCITPCFADTA